MEVFLVVLFEVILVVFSPKSGTTVILDGVSGYGTTTDPLTGTTIQVVNAYIPLSL